MYIFYILSAVRSYQLCIKDKRLSECLWLNMCIYIHNYMVVVFIERTLSMHGGAVWDISPGVFGSHTLRILLHIIIASFEYWHIAFGAFSTAAEKTLATSRSFPPIEFDH
jgi:hypothetical protein